MKNISVVLLCLALLGCQRSPSEVVDKVLVDFGVREKPEGYVSGEGAVFKRLSEIAPVEMKHLNQQAQQGEVLFQEEAGLHGKFYKQVKVYENFYPTAAEPVSKTTEGDRGYVGYVEYAYRVYESARKGTRAEAAAEPANIATGQSGRETYRYDFNGSGEWNGAKGERTKR